MPGILLRIAASITVEPLSASTVRVVPLWSLKLIFGMRNCRIGRAGIGAGVVYRHSSGDASLARVALASSGLVFGPDHNANDCVTKVHSGQRQPRDRVEAAERAEIA